MADRTASARRRGLRLAAYVVVWLVLAVVIGGWWFLHTDEPVVVATHDAVVTPTADHHATLDLGPYVPDLRVRTAHVVGARIVVGKTTAVSTEQLIQRYAALAVRPQQEIRRVRSAVRRMAVDAALRGAVVATLPVGLWLLVGPERRRRLLHPWWRAAGVVVGAAVVVGVVVWTPWRQPPPPAGSTRWTSLSDALPDVAVPRELAGVQVEGGLLTEGTQRLVGSGVRAYANGKAFYRRLAKEAPANAQRLHMPASDQTVAVLISDRHDNNGMDAVVRAYAEQAHASAVIDAGDDTSTGESWEEFSLNSLTDAFDEAPYTDDGHRVAIAGNHDHGSFVSRHLAKQGWQHLDGTATTVFDGVRVLGVDDPRSSGLGDWRDSLPSDWGRLKTRLADTACKADADGERLATVVVHDAHLAQTVLDRGCVDLVLAGHLHTEVGPTRVLGSNGKAGYNYTNGTTGGAAYAVAIGSKLRRDAEFTFVTYAHGRPAGIQPVTIKTNGVVQVAAYQPLDLG